MNMNIDVSISQKQILSQSQIQSLEILAMDSQELNNLLTEEYLENPLLDYTGENSGPSKTVDINSAYESIPSYGKNYDDTAEDEEKTQKDIADESKNDVKSFLLSQLLYEDYSDTEWRLIHYLIDCLEDSGFFIMSPKEIAAANKVPCGMVEKCLKDLRQLEPYGIFAEDLKHCLLKQIEVRGKEDPDIIKIIMDFLPDVAAGKISNISRALKLSTLQVRKYIEQIACLNPRPLTGFCSERTPYVVPDIIFYEENGVWEIEQNDSWINDYKVNDYYLKLMSESKDKELTSYFRMKLERIRFIMNSIEQRRDTILSIAQSALERQKEYFAGKGQLQPMTMTQIAEIIGVHPSTVSRAIKGKYIQCPRGSVSMKDLFTSAVSKAEGDSGISASYVKHRIKELVEKEDKRKPYSDQNLTKLLENMNISISRRAVAKYREEIGIKGSFERKVS